MHLIECLAARRMFALAEFEVLGTSGDDQIIVSVNDGGTVDIYVNGNKQTVARDTFVKVMGLEGNDKIHVSDRPPTLNEQGQIVRFDGPRYFVDAGAGNDTVMGSDNDDLITGSGGDDRLYGGGGDDELSGGNGSDTLFGSSGDDTLLGGRGRDRLQAGEGTNLVDGGDGVDRFWYRIRREDNPMVTAPVLTVGSLTFQELYHRDGSIDFLLNIETQIEDGISVSTSAPPVSA
jgi:Ca2+-binding RTX toxin-like protein